MKVKRCNAIIVEKDIFGSREFFFENDIVSIQYGDKKNPTGVTGRIMELPYNREFYDNDYSIIQLDVSTKYHRQTIRIREDDIISIIKIPG